MTAKTPTGAISIAPVPNAEMDTSIRKQRRPATTVKSPPPLLDTDCTAAECGDGFGEPYGRRSVRPRSGPDLSSRLHMGW